MGRLLFTLGIILMLISAIFLFFMMTGTGNAFVAPIMKVMLCEGGESYSRIEADSETDDPSQIAKVYCTDSEGTQRDMSFTASAALSNSMTMFGILLFVALLMNLVGVRIIAQEGSTNPFILFIDKFLDFFIKLNISDRNLGLLLLAPAAILITVFALYPIIQGFIVSLNHVNYATLEMKFVWVDKYAKVLNDGDFWDATWRTLVYVFVTNFFTLVLGMLISLLVHQELVGRNIARGLVLFPYLVPAIVIALTWRYMLDPTLGVINVWLKDLGLIERQYPFLGRPNTAIFVVIFASIWKYTPFMIIMFLARLQVIPPDLEEAAKLDGANGWQIFWKITVPWMMPVIIIALLLRTIWTFNEFEMVYLFAFGGPLSATTTLPVYVRNLASESQDLGAAAAASTMMLVLLLAMSWGYFRLYANAEQELN